MWLTTTWTVVLLAMTLTENNFVLSMIHTLGFCADCFPELGDAKRNDNHKYKIDVTSSEFANWLHVVVRRADLQGRLVGVVIQAIDQSGLPVGRFGAYACAEDGKYSRVTKEVSYFECDLHNENMREHPNVACLDRRATPLKESHITWRFTELDKSKIESIQFIGIVVENFVKKKAFTNVRSPKLLLDQTSKGTGKLVWNRSDLEGKCHLSPLSSQWTLSLSPDNQEANTTYINRIQQWKALVS